jgi:predicted nucleic acid-binding protein
VAEDRTGPLYVDASALVKLVVREAESAALERELEHQPDLATSTLTAIELARAVARARADGTVAVADERTLDGLLAATAEIPLTDEIRARASTLAPVQLRTLDAIHLASALTLAGDLDGLLTYDARMQQAAAAHGIVVLAPS